MFKHSFQMAIIVECGLKKSYLNPLDQELKNIDSICEFIMSSFSCMDLNMNSVRYTLVLYAIHGVRILYKMYHVTVNQILIK